MPEKTSQTHGHLHPLSQIITEVTDIFKDLGFTVALGPEVETEYNNFDALNVAQDHPARDMQDTFWLEPLDKNMVLRTHTTSVQARWMKDHKPPFRIIVPGKVFRNEATDATHEAQFHQLDGFLIDKDISMAHLKGVLHTFLKKLFGESVEMRLRPSFFPFVEPGVEVDVSCFKCGGDGCNVCKQSGWIEVLGAGLVHPNVMKGGGIDPTEWSGLAFGVGVDRLVMLRYGVTDVRLLYGSDIRFTKQF